MTPQGSGARFCVRRTVSGVGLFLGNQCVETGHTPRTLEYAARELNAGRAYLAPHAPIGCRVQPISGR